MRVRSLLIGLCVAVGVAWIAAPGLSQTIFGTILGTVTDPSGAAIPQASLELVNTGTNEHRTGKTNEQGSYDFTALSPGNYKLSASHPGFSQCDKEMLDRVLFLKNHARPRTWRPWRR